ncbi:MAG: hypothetical protein LUI13_07035 [Lachnospiraceae bacterium]|nr:hypothetical protein [Lachnospiraceae bacterium]
MESQKMRELAPELDPLRIGTGWKQGSDPAPFAFKEHLTGSGQVFAIWSSIVLRFLN